MEKTRQGFDKGIIISIFIGIGLFMPQYYELFQVKATAGLSIWLPIFSILLQSIMIFRQVVFKDIALVVFHSSACVLQSILIVMIVYYRYLYPF